MKGSGIDHHHMGPSFRGDLFPPGFQGLIDGVVFPWDYLKPVTSIWIRCRRAEHFKIFIAEGDALNWQGVVVGIADPVSGGILPFYPGNVPEQPLVREVNVQVAGIG